MVNRVNKLTYCFVAVVSKMLLVGIYIISMLLTTLKGNKNRKIGPISFYIYCTLPHLNFGCIIIVQSGLVGTDLSGLLDFI